MNKIIDESSKSIKFEDTRELDDTVRRAACAAMALHQWRMKNTKFQE